MLGLGLPAEVTAIASVLTDAFAADPVVGWMFPEPERRAGQLGRLALVTAHRGVAHGHGYVWRGAGVIDGAAMWAPAGVSFYTADDVLRITDLITAADPGRAPTVLAGLAQMVSHQPSEPHFVLPMIGVRPDAQGAGIGPGLMAGVLEHIDRLGCLAYLESSNPRNVSLYLRHGFEVLAEIELPDGGPTVRPMLRHPRR